MNTATVPQWVTFGMNTTITHSASGKNAKAALDAVHKETARLESMLSRFIPGSEVDSINRFAGIKPVGLSEETYEVLAQAKSFSETSGGLFDVTIGPLVDLWRESRAASIPPEEQKIIGALSMVNDRDLLIDADKRTARLKRAGQSVDLGGIAKGFAGDRFMEIFRQYGVSSAYTNIGGNVVVSGAKPDGSLWRVGIRHPRLENGLIGLVTVYDKAVVTSGDDQRYFIGHDGKRYHHILNPKTGYPAESGILSVTVVANSSLIADALSTVLFIAGIRKGLKLLEGYPGIEAVFVEDSMKVNITRGLKDSFQAAEGISMNVINN